MATLTQLTERFGREVYDHVAAEFGDVDVPVLAGPQSQGDVRVRPLADTRGVTVRAGAVWRPVGAAGVDVVRPVGGGHTHTLLAEPGGAEWTEDVDDATGLAVGVVRSTGTAWLLHAEHGLTGVAPGEYLIRRQREEAEVQRIVAD